MKFRCNSILLMEAIQTVIRVMPNRTPMEILQGILLDADEKGLHVAASDGNMTSISYVPAEIETDGSVVLPGRLLSEVIRKLPSDQLEASLNNRFVLNIRSGGSRFNISGRNAEEFPLPEETGYTSRIDMPQPMLREMVHMISFAVPEEDQRVVLTGGYMNLNNGNIDMVGLDGFRMALKHAQISDTQTQTKAIIPCKALGEIEKLMGDDEEQKALLSFSQNRLKIECSQTKFYTSLIEGEYIDYRRVIPKAFNLMATVETGAFADCIERAALIARSSRNNLIKLEIGNGEIVFSANSEAGDVREELPAQIQGEELIISFNVRYLSELARIITGEEIVLKFGSAVSPCVITPVSGDEFTYLILPVRTNA